MTHGGRGEGRESRARAGDAPGAQRLAAELRGRTPHPIDWMVGLAQLHAGDLEAARQTLGALRDPVGRRFLAREIAAAQAALRTNLLPAYTYTHKTILKASSKNLKIVSVPVRINPPTRRSRLIDTTLKYILRSAHTILRTYIVYAPLRVFSLASLLLFAPGGFLVGRVSLLLLRDTAAPQGTFNH